LKSFKSSGSLFKDFQRKLDLYDKEKPRTCGLLKDAPGFKNGKLYLYDKEKTRTCGLLKDAPGFKNGKLYLYDKEKTRNTFSRLSPDKNFL